MADDRTTLDVSPAALARMSDEQLDLVWDIATTDDDAGATAQEIADIEAAMRARGLLS